MLKIILVDGNQQALGRGGNKPPKLIFGLACLGTGQGQGTSGPPSPGEPSGTRIWVAALLGLGLSACGCLRSSFSGRPRSGSLAFAFLLASLATLARELGLEPLANVRPGLWQQLGWLLWLRLPGELYWAGASGYCQPGLWQQGGWLLLLLVGPVAGAPC